MVVVLNMFNKFFSVIAMLFIGNASLITPDAIADVAPDVKIMMVVNYAEWEKRRLQYVPKILVVDMWAMWCSSCIERFPEMIKLHEKYNNNNIEFVSMNLDDREDAKSLEIAEKFLEKMNADFDHYHMNENLLYAFEKINLIGIPAVLIYDSNGNETYRLTGDDPNNQFTEKDIEVAIKSLLDVR